MRLLLLLVSFCALASCDMMGGKRVRGNGNITTKTPAVGAFHSVEGRGSVTIRLRQDSTNSVRIETDENLMDYIEASIQRGTLVIEPKDGFNIRPSKDLVVYTSAPSYRSVEVAGAGKIISEGIISGTEALEVGVSGSGSINMEVALPRVSTNVSGAGDVYLKGTSREFKGSISGSGSIKAFDLTTDVSTLQLSGAADAEITANQKLEVSVSGAGNVRYKGNPQVSQSISGAGSVKKA